MRWMIVMFLVATAWADKKVVDMTPGYKRELGSCEIEQGGVQRMIDKAKRYVAGEPADKADVEKDVERLAKGLELVTSYCQKLGAIVQFLETNATTPYKKIEKPLDDHYRAVVNARKEAKKELEELAPITRKLIPIVNARVTQIETQKRTGKFPSGRVVDLPSGTWKLGGNAATDIAELSAKGVMATVTSQSFTKMSCEQQRKVLVEKAGADISEVELSPAAKAIDVMWALRYVRRDKTPHALTTMCIEDATGGFLAIADVTPADAQTNVTTMMAAMLSSRRGSRTSSRD